MNRRRMRTPVIPLFVALTMGVPPFAARAESVGDDGSEVQVTADDRLTKSKALTDFADNLTALALSGQFADFLGESELKRKFREQLALPGQESMYLLGPRGSGKTALMEQMAKELAPDGYVIWSLRVGDLQAGSKYRGDLEKRIKLFLQNFDGQKNLILFVDEFHSAMEVAKFTEILKPLMGRKKITLVAGTTEEEFTEFVEKNKALVDRAPKFIMEEFDLAKTIDVLGNKAQKLESEYHIDISYEAIERAAKLAMLYYPDMSPSRASERILSRTLMRKKLDQDNERFDTLKIQDQIDASNRKIALMQKDIRRKQGVMDMSGMRARVEAERGVVDRLTVKLNKSQFEAQREELNEQMAKVAKELALYKSYNDPDTNLAMDQLRGEYAQLQNSYAELGNGGPVDMGADELRAEDVGRFVAHEVGITVETANETDGEKLARLEKGLRENLFGQDHVIDAIVNAVRNRLANIDKYSGPIAVMLFDGPRGTGKTTVEKILTEVFYGNAKRVVRVTMNTGGSMGGSGIWGPPPGIVDSEKGGQIDQLRQNPHSLLAIEEADKTDATEMDQWHQAWDEGKQRDARGRMVNFTHTLVTITANLTGGFANVVEEYNNPQLERAMGWAPGTLDNMSTKQKMAYALDSAIHQKGWSESIQDRITVKMTFNRVDRTMAKQILKKKLEDQAKEIFANHRVTLEYGQNETAESGKRFWDVLVDHYFNANESGRYYGRDLRDHYLTSVISGLFTSAERFEPGSVVKVEFQKNEAADRGKGDRTGELVYTFKYKVRDTPQLFKDEKARTEAITEARKRAEKDGLDIEQAMAEAANAADQRAHLEAASREAELAKKEQARKEGKVTEDEKVVHITLEEAKANPALVKPGVVVTETLGRVDVFMKAVDKPALSIGRNAGGAGRAENAAAPAYEDGSTSEIKPGETPEPPPTGPKGSPRRKAAPSVHLNSVKPGQNLGKR